MHRILHLIPRLPPPPCGVADYAIHLAHALASVHSIHSEFLVPTSSATQADGFPVRVIGRRNANSAVGSVARWTDGCKAVVIQYSGYGYARRGAPLWLVGAIRKFRRIRPGIRVVTMFHELFATSLPHRSAFWFSLPQRFVARRLALMSNTLITNRTASMQWLARAAPMHDGRIIVMPVFSNLGEPTRCQPPSLRPSHLVTFGYQAPRIAGFWNGLADWVTAAGVEHVTVISPGEGTIPPSIGSASVSIHGYLAEADVSAILKTARFGFLAYNPAFLGKSGLLAAFASHGVVPVLATDSHELSEDLLPGVHLIPSGTGPASSGLEDIDRMSASIRSWYQPHSIASTEMAYARAITDGRD